MLFISENVGYILFTKTSLYLSVIFVHYAVFRYVGYILLALCRLWCILESRKETDIYKRLFKERIKENEIKRKNELFGIQEELSLFK